MGVKLSEFDMPHGARDWFLIGLIALMTVIPIGIGAYVIFSNVLPVLGLR